MIKNDISAAILSAVMISRQPKPDVNDDSSMRNVNVGRICPDEQWRRYLDNITMSSVQSLADGIRKNGTVDPLKVRLDPHPEHAKELETSVDIGEYITSLLPTYIGTRVVGVYEDGRGYIDAEFAIKTDPNALRILECDLVKHAEYMEPQQSNRKLDIIIKMLGEIMANQKVGKDKNVSSAS